MGQSATNQYVRVTFGFNPITDINLAPARQAARRLPEFLLTFTVYLGDTSCLLNSARLVSLF
jgi:hypothetical protein